MRRALHAEWIRVGGRRLAIWTALAAFGSTVGGFLIAFIITGVAEAGETPGVEEQQVFVLSRGTVTVLLVSIIAALAVGTHFRYATILSASLAVPQRPQMMLVVVLPQVLTAVTLGLVSASAALFGAILIRGQQLLSLTIVAELVTHMLLAGVAAIWACMLGFVTRSFALTLGAVIAWPSLIEPLVAGGISALAPEAGTIALIVQPYAALRGIGESFAVERTLMATTSTEAFVMSICAVLVWTTALTSAALIRTTRSSALVSP